MKCDVAIVGAGLAGLVAAIEARAHGANALVLDKLPDPEKWNAVTQLPGGTGNDTWRSGGGGLARFAGDKLVEHLLDGPGELEAGKDPVDVLLARHQRLGWDSVDTALLRSYCQRIFDDCCWLRDELKMPYDATGRTVKGLGIGLFKTLYQRAIERGVQFSFETSAQSLATDSAGRITGLRATRGGAPLEIETPAVVLATGGFQGDRALLREHAGTVIADDVAMVGSPENTGDGHRMAQALGAQLRHLGVVHIRTTDFFFGQGPSRYLLHIYPMGIYFNKRFERFVDEGVADSDTIANAIALQPGSVATLVFDDKARQRHAQEFERYPRRNQLIESAPTLRALAKQMNIDADGLERVVAAYNASIRDGQASGPNLPKTRLAMPIDTAPFHGFHPVRPAVNHTLGGLAVDPATCGVLNTEGKVIPGLYAGGTIVNWAFGKPFEINGITTYRGSYHAGASSGAGTALVFGRLAGATAAKQAARA